MNTLKGKSAVVTGSGQGIGREIAAHLAELGAQVVISDVNAAACSATVSDFSAKGWSAISMPANVTVASEVDSLLQKTIAAYGTVDIVVNNAGVTRDTLMVRMSEDDWDLVLNVNLKGPFLVTRAAGKIMMKQRAGRIINIASVVGIMGNAGQANYSASKAGLIGLTKSAAKELAPRGITVNAVAPGFIQTAMTDKLTEEVRAQYLAAIPLRRLGQPTDVAAAVAFFASDSAGYITGQVLPVCGGLIM